MSLCYLCCDVCIFFFKQKTAYEMRISDWSSECALPIYHAAGALFLNEAGGKAARPDGSAYRADEYERRELIGASSPALWDEFAEIAEIGRASCRERGCQYV